MSQYIYPAIFTKEDNGQYSVIFPDIEGCFTGGNSLLEALENSEDALSLMLYDFEEKEKTIPSPSDLEAIKLEANEFVNFIKADTLYYKQKFSDERVKVTLTPFKYLVEEGKSKGINLTQLFNEALIEELNH